MFGLRPLVLELGIVYRVEAEASSLWLVPGGQQHSSPEGSASKALTRLICRRKINPPAPHQTQKEFPVLFGAKVIRIDVNALLHEEPLSLRFVDVRLHARLATCDELRMPDGEATQS